MEAKGCLTMADSPLFMRDSVFVSTSALDTLLVLRGKEQRRKTYCGHIYGVSFSLADTSVFYGSWVEKKVG